MEMNHYQNAIHVPIKWSVRIIMYIDETNMARFYEIPNFHFNTLINHMRTGIDCSHWI